MQVTIRELLDYTDEERGKWRTWLADRNGEPLAFAVPTERTPTVGALILHCFWTERFYAHWMRGEILNDNSDVVRENRDLRGDRVEPLFAFGRAGRQMIHDFVANASAQDWDRVYEVEAAHLRLRGSARKLLAHLMLHEIRHFAQLTVAVRQHGLAPPGDHDLLFSRSFGPLVTRV